MIRDIGHRRLQYTGQRKSAKDINELGMNFAEPPRQFLPSLLLLEGIEGNMRSPEGV